MRKLFALCMIACAPALFAVTKYEVSSSLYEMTIEVEGEGEEREYAVRVVDNETGALLASERLSGPGAKPQLKVEADGLVIRVHVSETGMNFTAALRVERNGVTIDSISASWLTKNRSGILPPPPSTNLGGPPYRVGGQVRAPVVIERIEPLYPDEARRGRVSGIVILEAIIDQNGDVKDVRVLKPLPFGMDQAAVDAVKQWKFRPGTMDGQPVDVIFNLTVNFRLPEDE